MAALLVMVAVAVAVAASPAAGVATQQPASLQDNDSDDGFGATISSFMQASAADAEGSVDNGMWVAGFARAQPDAKVGMVSDRTEALERRLTRLEREREALLNESADNVSMADRARAARLTTRAQALQEAINDTRSAGLAVGVDVSRLEELRNRARNLSGPEVAALAGNITDTPDGGPPDGVGPSGETNSSDGTQSGGASTGAEETGDDGNTTATERGSNHSDGAPNDGSSDSGPANDG